MNLADRIRGVVRGSIAGSVEPTNEAAAAGLRTAEILGGEQRDWHGHPYVVIDRKYPPRHVHGRVAMADCAPGRSGSWPALSVVEPAAKAGRTVFIDLETTGLAGGAGTYAFLVGCGWFESGSFHIRQFLLAAFAAEPGLLQELADAAAGAGAVATYNGKTFDLPLIEMRFLFHRMATPFAALPHIDMLHSARRLWGGGVRRPGSADSRVGSADPAYMSSCRLAAVEEAVLGHVREDDVPGFEIPSRYFHYVRSGDPRPLQAVIEHNRLDLLSLAMLTARAAELLEQGAAAARTAQEALGLGRLYERSGMLPEARASYARAVDMEAADTLVRAEALRAYAVLCRRARQYDDAVRAWHRILELRRCPSRVAREASDALAVHYEHRRRDFQVARQVAVESLQFGRSLARMDAVRHRLARLSRKLGEHAAGPLF